MAHSVQKVVQRCEDAEENGGELGEFLLLFYDGVPFSGKRKKERHGKEFE